MTTLCGALSERKEELLVHFALAEALDRQLFESESVSIGSTTLSVRHLMTIKSGLIVHLYNIVESIMTRTIEEVGRKVQLTSPAEWTSDTLKEWLRFNASTGIDGSEDTRLEVVHKAALKLLAKETIQELKFKKPSGTWSDKVIYTFSKRLNVDFTLTPEMAQKIMPSTEYGDKTPLEFRADRRNAIAHGRRSFETGASDLTLQQIQGLANVTIEYMELTIVAFQSFLDEKKYTEAVV